MRLLPGVELDLGPADWRGDSDGAHLRLLVTRVSFADGYYDDDAGPYVRVQGLDQDDQPRDVYVRLTQ